MRTTILFASILLGLFILGAGDLYAGYYDSGFIQFQQPDGTIFVGREYGDEFIFYRETPDGYRYVQGADGWYYFATVDAGGNLVASTQKVGIHPAPA